MHNVINAQKDDVFRIRMNSEIKSELEKVFAKNGLTLTDAVNVFFQQALNTGGFPFSVTEDNSEKMRGKALSKLMKELEIGMNCTESYSEEEAKKLLGEYSVRREPLCPELRATHSVQRATFIFR